MKARLEGKRGAYMTAFMANEQPMADAASLAVREAGDEIKTDARAQIASAGFGRKWQNALRVDSYPRGGTASINAAAHIYHKIHYAWVFEEGATISGKPLLWLPLSNVARRIGRNRLTPARYPGPLQYVKRPGRSPLLVAKIRMSKAAARRAHPKLTAAAMRRGTGGRGVLRSVPVFVGISTVRLRKQFNITKIVNRAAGRLGELYWKHLKVDD